MIPCIDYDNGTIGHDTCSESRRIPLFNEPSTCTGDRIFFRHSIIKYSYMCATSQQSVIYPGSIVCTIMVCLPLTSSPDITSSATPLEYLWYSQCLLCPWLICQSHLPVGHCEIWLRISCSGFPAYVPCRKQLRTDNRLYWTWWKKDHQSFYFTILSTFVEALSDITSMWRPIWKSDTIEGAY